jgi:glycosyltransferase involved in cell wall biosynthesis
MPDGPTRCSLLHVLVSLRAEGTPRLALELLREEKRQTGSVGHVAFLHAHLRDLEPRFSELGVILHELPWRKRRFDRLFLQSLGLFRRLRPLGIICYPLGAHVPVALAATILGIPCVAHVGNTPPLHQPKALRILRLQMLAGLPLVKKYVCCSDGVREQICRHYSLPRRKTCRVYNGIVLEKFFAVRKRRRVWRGGRLRIGMVASLEPSKDQSTLLRAIAEMKRQGDDVELRLIGAGSLREQLQETARKLGILDCVSFRGVIDDVPAELAELDVFAFSATPDEGMGIALVEALAAGVPCVGSNVMACREVLRDGDLGTIVPAQDAGLWAEALRDAAGRPSIHPHELSPYQIGTTLLQYRDALFGRDHDSP